MTLPKALTDPRHDPPAIVRGGSYTPVHRRQLFGMAGAILMGASVTGWVAHDAQSEADDDDDGEVEDPRSGLQQLIWTVPTDQPLAALTFDDGPHPDLTPRILEILDSHGVKATFMAMGYAAQRHRSLLAEVVAAGHEVGHHTWRHHNLSRNSVKDTRDEIDNGVRLVEDAAGVQIGLFRPPRGRLSEAAVRLVAQHRHDIVLWSVTRGPLDERSPRRVADHLVMSVGPGDVIDLHDGIGRGTFDPDGAHASELMERRLTELEALPSFIEEVGSRGIRLGTVSELIDARATIEV